MPLDTAINTVAGFTEVAEVAAFSDPADPSNRLCVNKHTSEYPDGQVCVDYEITVHDEGLSETILLTVAQLTLLFCTLAYEVTQ